MAEYYSCETVLNDGAVASVVADLTPVYLKIAGKRAMGKTKFKIALEELLLQFRDCYGTDKPCKIIFVRRFLKLQIEISQDGAQKEWMPFDEDIKISYNILAKLGVSPRYSFSDSGDGHNRVIWESLLKARKNGTLFSMLSAIVLAIVFGLLINSSSAHLHIVLVDEMVTPLFAKLTAILSAVATPLVFFAVIGGIIGIGDVKSFGKIGSKVLSRMMISYGISALLLAVGAAIAYGVTFTQATAEQGSAGGKILQMVLDIVPDNLVMPFAQDNDLQVISVSIFVGVTMLLLGNRISKLNELVKECSDLINKMMMICCKFIPLIVFLGVLKLICTSNAKQFISIGKMLVVYLVINGIFLSSMYIRACLITKTPITKIFPKQLATMMINLTTSSQVAALPENMKCCKKKFGIDEKLVDFALPLGIVIYMPSGTVFIGICAYAMAVSMGITVTFDLLVRITLVAVILAISAPPIPGSAFVILPILFTSCGIPQDAFPLAIIFSTIIGYIVPTFNGINIQLELLMTAKKLNKIDDSVLKKEYIET